MNCQFCGDEIKDNHKFCSDCGTTISPEALDFIITTTPTI
ncbi:MAG: zinc-ribbon domain-containing protein [Candidatus Bathyarchaeota archaeon]|nr:zinc-ribbon domain-containing protein [Candidatus Bathyarchaeota archaeon]MDP7443801.1 zinc-ribbon domain-containing protein [Candidatus Bathyarchaeota archaeon]